MHQDLEVGIPRDGGLADLIEAATSGLLLAERLSHPCP
jgi:hypothetical protein